MTSHGGIRHKGSLQSKGGPGIFLISLYNFIREGLVLYMDILISYKLTTSNDEEEKAK